MIDLSSSEWLSSLPRDMLAQTVNPGLSDGGVDALLASGGRKSFLDLANERLTGTPGGEDMPKMARYLMENPAQISELVKLIGALASGKGVRQMVGRDDVGVVKDFLGEAYYRAAIRNADARYAEPCSCNSGGELVDRIGTRGRDLMGGWIGNQSDPVSAAILRAVGPEYAMAPTGRGRYGNAADGDDFGIYDAAFNEFEIRLRGGL